MSTSEKFVARCSDTIEGDFWTEPTPYRGVTIRGNYSSTQYPSFYKAEVDHRSANEAIGDEKCLKEQFMATVQQRGAAIIKARGVFLLARPQTQFVDTVCFLTDGTPRDS